MASGPVVLDPDELESFARELRAFSMHLASSAKQLNSRFGRLGETWRDPAYAAFAREFEQTMRNIDRFCGTAEQMSPSLMSTARRARDVHKG